MVVGVFLPILRVDKYGYQYNYRITIENLLAFADKLYIRLNDEIPPDLEHLRKNKKIILIANNDSHSFNENGYNISRIKKANRDVLRKMRKDKIDIALNIHINQYIPQQSFIRLKEQCNQVYNSGKKYGWLYKRYQLKNKLFNSDIRLPWILNLNHKSTYYSPDSITEKGKIIAKIQTGAYNRYNNSSIVDYQFEQTIADLEKKINYVRNYSDLNKSKGIIAPSIFDENQHFRYYQNKVNKKVLYNGKLDIYGERIATNSKPEFISWYFLKNYSSPSTIRKFYRFWQGQIAYGTDFLKSYLMHI